MKTIRKKIKQENYIYFSVYVNRNNAKGHNEVYRLPKLAYSKYKQLGYDKAFFDFKPQQPNTNAGVYKVNKITTTNDKTYYETSHGTFTLPKYLHSKLPTTTHIAYSERVTSK